MAVLRAAAAASWRCGDGEALWGAYRGVGARKGGGQRVVEEGGRRAVEGGHRDGEGGGAARGGGRRVAAGRWRRADGREVDAHRRPGGGGAPRGELADGGATDRKSVV